MDYSQFLTMWPEVLLLGVFILVFLYDTFSNEAGRRFTGPIATMLFGAMTVVQFFFPSEMTASFGGMYVNTPAVVCIKLILNIGSLIVIIQALKWTETDEMKMRRGEFFELLMVTLLGMYLMVSARHFLLFIIGLETASLPLAAMAAFNKDKYESHEAAIKYIMTAVFSSAILMMGVSLIYAISGGSLYFSDIAAMIATEEISAMLIVGLAFIMAGLGFKLSLVPFHLWTADVYEGAPTAVTSYLSVISKGAAAFTFLVIFTQVFGTVYADAWEWMLYALIITTITVGNLFAIRQKNMKRFMAFSSVSQAGYIMLGVISVSTLGLTSMMYYILVYIFSNLAAFGVIATIENKTGKLLMTEYNGLHKTNPWLSFAMTLAMFSLAGIPPFAGFFSKFLIFTSATQVGTVAIYVLVGIALINTIVSLYYYLLVVKAMWISGDEPVIPSFRSCYSERAAMWLCILGIVFLGLVSWFYDSIYNYVTIDGTLFASMLP